MPKICNQARLLWYIAEIALWHIKISFLGQFNIELVPSRKGTNQIEVSFDIDASGILTVSAVDKALNKPNKITIESSSSLTDEEIERMKASKQRQMLKQIRKRRKRSIN